MWGMQNEPTPRRGRKSATLSEDREIVGILRRKASGLSSTICYDARVSSLSIVFAFLIGAASGAGLVVFFRRNTARDAEAIAERLSAAAVTKQTEQILHLAETKLSGKKEVIDGTLQAMKQDLDRVEKLLRDIDKGNAQVGDRLQNAATIMKDLDTTARNLKTALASNSTRGQWVERMAEDVLRLSGLIENVNYIKQTKLNAAGSRPDFTFLLPKQLKLNMDVKFPFSNYQLFVDASSEADREKAKKAFLADVKRRIKEVQTRDYINPEDHTVDYVLLFVPNEQIYTFINELDSALMDEAMQGKTILCSPMTLYAILAVIRQSIDNFALETKAQEMLSLFGTFRDQWKKFKEQMETVGDRLESARKGYEELTGVRQRQLEKPLEKIDELRAERGIAAAEIPATFERAAKKNLATVGND